MLQCAQRVQSSLTVCLASATLYHGVLDKCCLMSRCDRRVLSHVTACSVSAVLHYRMLGECCLAYGLLGECYTALRCA